MTVWQAHVHLEKGTASLEGVITTFSSSLHPSSGVGGTLDLGLVNGFCYEKVWSSNKEHSRIIWSCSWFADSQHFVTASRDMQVANFFPTWTVFFLWPARTLPPYYNTRFRLCSGRVMKREQVLSAPTDAHSPPQPLLPAARSDPKSPVFLSLTVVPTFFFSDAIIAVGLQDGSVLLLSKNGDHLDVRASLFAPAVPVDSAITRIRWRHCSHSLCLSYHRCIEWIPSNVMNLPLPGLTESFDYYGWGMATSPDVHCWIHDEMLLMFCWFC